MFQSFSLGSSDDEDLPVSISSDALKEEAVICEYRGAQGEYDIWKIIRVQKEEEKS